MKKALLLTTILLLLPLAYSKVDYLGIETSINENVDIKVIVSKANYFEFKVYGLILNYSSNADCKLEGNLFKCYSPNSSAINVQITLNNILSKAPNKNILSEQFEISDDIERVTSLVTLPVGMILSNETDSVFPKDFKTLSNGRNIIVFWEIGNVTKNQILSFKLTYSPVYPEESFFVKFARSFYAALIIAAFFISLLIYELIKTKKIAKVRVPKEKIILEVLDKDEKKIYEIVEKEGKIKQNKIVELTGFSKARVSRVIKKLSEKKLINVEKAGKTNIISIKKKRGVI